MQELNEKIKHLYLDEKLSYRQVAKRLGIADSTAAKRIKAMGISRTSKEASQLRSSSAYSESIRQTKIGDRNHQAKLAESDVLEIRDTYPLLLGTHTKTQAQYLLAKQYGVKRPTISDVVLRNTWKHI